MGRHEAVVGRDGGTSHRDLPSQSQEQTLVGGWVGERAVSRYLGPQMFSFGRRFVEGNFAAIRLRFVRLADQPFRYATPS